MARRPQPGHDHRNHAQFLLANKSAQCLVQNCQRSTEVEQANVSTTQGLAYFFWHFSKIFQKSRPSLAKVIDSISPARIRDTEVSSSSSDSSSSSSDSSSSESDSEETKRPPSQDSGNGDGDARQNGGDKRRKRPAENTAEELRDKIMWFGWNITCFLGDFPTLPILKITRGRCRVFENWTECFAPARTQTRGQLGMITGSIDWLTIIWMMIPYTDRRVRLSIR